MLLLVLAESAWRGYGIWALFGLALWIPLVWFGAPSPAVAQELLLGPGSCELRQGEAAQAVAMELLPGTVLLPWLVVLHWRPTAGRGRYYLWLWAGDLGEQRFRDLRRWWLVFGPKKKLKRP